MECKYSKSETIMTIKEKDRFDVIGQNINYIIDSIENGIVYYHSIGKFHTNPNSESRSIKKFVELIKMGLIKTI